MTTGLHRRQLLATGGAAIAAVALAAPRSHLLAVSTAVPQGESLARFLPPGFSPGEDDVAPALEAAARWSSLNGQPVVVTGRYRLGRAARIDAEGATLHFSNAELVLRNGLEKTRTRTVGAIPTGLYICATRVSLLGACRIAGDGVPGKSFLQGMFAEEADELNLGNFDLVNLAIGQHFMACDKVVCADTTASGMWGLQMSGDGVVAGAGSAQVISGCRDGRFGALLAIANDKCARYLSVGVHSRSGPRDNAANIFGFANVTGRQGSDWSQNTGIRSSVGSRFAGGTGKNLSFLLLCQKYKTDDRYQITDNEFGDWDGEIIDGGGSVDAAIYFATEPGARAIGSNRIGSVRARNAPQSHPGPRGYSQTFGLFATSGQLFADSLEFDGFTFHVNASDCDLRIGSILSKHAAYQPMQYGWGLRGHIDRFTIAEGLSGNSVNAGLIRAVDSGTRGTEPSFRIEEMRCTGGSCDKSDYILYNTVFRENSLSIKNITGKGRRGTVWDRR